MRHRSVWALAGAIGGLFLAMAAPAGRCQAPDVGMPEWKTGDEWRYSDGTVVRVASARGARPVFAVLPNRANDPTVALNHLDFPLRVGKSWTVSQTLRQRTTGNFAAYDNTVTIDRYEEVKTKAGTFTAFRILWEQKLKNGAGIAPWRGYLFMWFSPELRAFIKREVQTPNWYGDFELESHSLR